MKDNNRYLCAILCVLTLLASMTGVTAKSPEPQTTHADLWIEDGIFVNGVELGIIENTTQYDELISYAGSVYIPLRSALELMGAESSFDGKAGTLTITRTKAPYVRERRIDVIKVEETPEESQARYAQFPHDALVGLDVELRSEISLFVDGAAQKLTNASGGAVYPISFRGDFYLPVRSVGELCGMRVAWLPADEPLFSGMHFEERSLDILSDDIPLGIGGAQIHLYTPLTSEQTISIENYIATAKELYNDCVAATVAFPDTSACTKEEAIAQMKLIASYGEQLHSLPAPDAPMFTWLAKRLNSYGWDIQCYRAEAYIERLEKENSTAAQILNDFDKHMVTSLATVRGQLEKMQQLFNTVNKQ